MILYFSSKLLKTVEIYLDNLRYYILIKKVKLIGGQNIIDSNPGNIYDDIVLRALNGKKEETIELNDDDDMQNYIF